MACVFHSDLDPNGSGIPDFDHFFFPDALATAPPQKLALGKMLAHLQYIYIYALHAGDGWCKYSFCYNSKGFGATFFLPLLRWGGGPRQEQKARTKRRKSKKKKTSKMLARRHIYACTRVVCGGWCGHMHFVVFCRQGVPSYVFHR